VSAALAYYLTQPDALTALSGENVIAGNHATNLAVLDGNLLHPGSQAHFTTITLNHISTRLKHPTVEESSDIKFS